MVEALIWAAAAFFIGGVFLLERRGLGQVALAHPLVLCLVAGYLTDQQETGIWIGISLQLLSVGQGHSANWALTGLVAAIALVYTSRYGIAIEPGDPSSLGIVATSVLAGMGARLLERRQARIDGETLRSKPVWNNDDPIRALEHLIHLRLLRGFFAGGFQTVFISTATVALATALHGVDHITPYMTTIATLMVPTLGTAAAIGSLARFRFIAYAGAGLLVIGAAVFI